jgi:hypothetical protein
MSRRALNMIHSQPAKKPVTKEDLLNTPGLTLVARRTSRVAKGRCPNCFGDIEACDKCLVVTN